MKRCQVRGISNSIIQFLELFEPFVQDLFGLICFFVRYFWEFDVNLSFDVWLLDLPMWLFNIKYFLNEHFAQFY